MRPPSVKLPLPLRNRLAELILAAFRESAAREVLDTLSRYCREGESAMSSTQLPAGFPVDFFDSQGGRLALRGAYRHCREALCDRVARAVELFRARPLVAAAASLGQALDEAAALFDARLHFEVHELLEPHWIRAEGTEREALQGLIQIAIGYHHLANDNLRGARLLLEEGSGRLAGMSLARLDLSAFAVAVRASLDILSHLGTDAAKTFDWHRMPPFPREIAHGACSTPHRS